MNIFNINSLRNALLGFTLLLVLPADAFTQEQPETFLISVTSEEGQVQGMALTLATTLVRRDMDVRILLCGPAGELALEENIPPSLRPRDISPKEMLLEAMSLGADVRVCELFLPNSGYRQYEESDLVEGIGQARADEIAELMLQPGVQTFTY